MSDTPPNLVLDMLRAVRGDLGELQADLHDVKERLGLLEAQYASASRRLERRSGDMDLVKRRLDLVEA